MGRLLYDLGRVEEKKRLANERGSSKVGKSSFSWAWELDGTIEERERYGKNQSYMSPFNAYTSLEALLWILRNSL